MPIAAHWDLGSGAGRRHRALARPLLLLVTLGAFGAAGLAQAAGPSAASSASRPVANVTLPMLADPGTLNPLYARDAYAREVALLTEPTLLRAGPGGTWLPYLAQAASVSAGGRVLTFRLNPNARWSSGARMTVRDVVATFKAAAVAADRTAYQGLFANLSSVQAVRAKPDTVEVTFRAPLADGLLRIGLVPILPASVVGPRTGSPGRLRAWNPVTVAGAVTGGPYRVLGGNLATGRVTFGTRRGFWIRMSIPSRVTLQYEFTTAEAWSAFVAGHLSAVSVPQADAKGAERLAAQGKAKIVHLPGTSDTFMAFNLRDPILRSAAVREAIWLSVPTSRIARMLGETPTPFGPSPWIPTGALEPGMVRRPDLAEARRLLASAGWQTAAQSPYRARNGQTLSFTCVTVTGVPTWDAAMSLVAESLKRVGIDMNITYLPFRTLSEMLASAKGLGTSIGAYALAYGSAPGSGAASLYGGVATEPPAGADAGAYANGVVTRLLLAGEGTPTVPKRRRLARRLAQALASDPPAVFFGTSKGVLAVSPSAKGYFTGPHAGLMAWWGEEGDL